MPQDKPIESIVENHTVQLGFIVGSIGEIKDAIVLLTKSQQKIEVIMERQANHEEANTNQHQHLHKRIDDLEEECDRLKPMARNGEMIYRIMLFVAKGFGGLAIASIFAVFMWAWKQGA